MADDTENQQQPVPPQQQPRPQGSDGDAKEQQTGETPAAPPSDGGAAEAVEQRPVVHRTGGPYVDPEVARAEEPGAGGPDGEQAGVAATTTTTATTTAVTVDAQGQPTEETDRLAAPVSTEQPPRLPFVVVGVGASAGGVEAFTEFLLNTPSDTGMAFVLVVHLPPERESMMADVMGKRTRMPVVQVEDGMEVRPDHVYVIRPGRTLLMQDGRLRLTAPLEKTGHHRPVDDFFRSLAAEQRERAAAVVLSGMGSNGTVGAQAIKAVGGVCIAQEPESALFPSMPRHLIDQGNADYILRPRDMPAALMRFAGHPYARSGGEAATAMQREQQDFADVLAILRTRTRQDFSGYKRPTLFRRVQRRMGLNQITRLGEYVRLMRNSASEVHALADDLLIHVTGFFRDPGAWESLSERVIMPMIAGRDGEQAIRCWVSACSSGEEAYTLAILIAEALDRLDKRLDVKIFATDMAERSLAHARSGSFPLGIEGEISPERLDRFFERDDSVYRVKKDLREMVVFAPQNVLSDPPFSRLDVCTCRNLLIYLEPEVQRRVLNLLHFGLRDGGALFLGTSETVGGVDELFEPVDKKWRIYRRVGPTRHGAVEFPLPRLLQAAARDGAGVERAVDVARPVQRLTVSQLTERALLQRYTPAAVVIDREYRVVYFHGPTERFLIHPAGEPTRELLLLCRDTVRGAVRTALTAAVEGGGTGEARDGTIQTDQGQRRVYVRVAPLDGRTPLATTYYLVSFEERDEPLAPAVPPGFKGDAGEVQRLSDELARVRDELQSTIEELQSSNEELETSKEELQSLNEELTTVNAQLQAKNEELQGTSSDLQSLLASTDIAVIFLDPRMRIRRFTPAVRQLVDLISSDVGRPISDLARKFEDDALLDDARAVLEKLVPREAEVRAAVGPNGAERWFFRRITPYRTHDDRIDGVVVTFFDITERKAAELALRASEEQFRRAIEEAPIPVIMHAEDGQVLQVSRTWTELTGYTLADVPMADAWLSRAYGPGADQVRRHMHDLFDGRKQSQNVEFAIRTRKGGDRYWSFSASAPGRLRDGRRFIVGMAVDITDRRQAEAGVRQSEERLRAITDLVPELLWESDASGGMVWCNQRWTEYTGQAGEQVTSYGWVDVVHPDDREQARARFQKAVEAAQPFRQEYRIRRASDGTYRWFLIQALPLRDDGGRVLRWFGSATDVHEQRTALDALGGGETQFRGLVEGVQDFAVFLLDKDSRITLWNKGAEQIMGWTAAEAVGQPGSMIFTPEDRAAGEDRKEVDLARREGRAPNIRWHLRKDGTRFFGNGVLTRLDGPNGGFVKIMRDETDRKRTEEELERVRHEAIAARAAAEQANQTKDEFLATASHELRTPLSAILIWSKALRREVTAEGREGQLDRESVIEAVSAIEHSATAQKRLIEDLLDTVRIEAGKLRLNLQDAELAPVVRAAVDAMRPEAAEKSVTLSADLSAEVGVVRADGGRIEQVVWNLVSNAVKFTPAGGRVDVTMRRAGGDDVEIRVSDSGIGILPEMLTHIFERFAQGEGGLVRASGGLGLGLTITRQLVELHGGTIEAQSGGRNKGATFTVRLPLPVVKRAKGKK
jgi:PAS domain S-box-containing protein